MADTELAKLGEPAIKYLEESIAKTHNNRAMELLGQCYKNGIGCEKNVKKGNELIELSGKEGENDKKINSGMIISSIAICTCIAVTAFNVYKRFFHK